MFEHIQQLPDPTTPVELAAALRITPAFVHGAIQRGELKVLFPASRRADRRLAHSAIVSWLNGDREASHTTTRDAITPVDPWVLLDTPDVCALVGKSRVTLWRWVRDGRFPTPDKVLPGGRKTWFRATVQNWMKRGSNAHAVRAAGK
jgi:predicted DNA-binding transcriptional regulator AlpA